MKKVVLSIGVTILLLVIVFGGCLDSNKDKNIIVESDSNSWVLIVDLFDNQDTNDSIRLFCQKGGSRENIRRTTGIDLRDSFRWIINVSNSSDSIFIYIHAHGSYSGYNNKNFSMSWKELGDYINNITSDEIGIYVNTCHSGSAIPYLQKENRVIETVCRWNETSCGALSFNNAIQGYADYEGNYDGYVSLEEVFDYESKEVHFCGIPQLSDNLPGEFHLVSVDKNYIDAENIDIINLHPNLNGQMATINEDFYCAQSFIPTCVKIDKIRFFAQTGYNEEMIDKDIIVNIRKNIDGENLSTVFISPDSITKGEFFDVDFLDMDVTPGEKYYIVFKTSSENNFRFATTENGYEGGECYNLGEKRPNMDLLFILYCANK